MPTLDLGSVVGPQGPQGVQGLQGERGDPGPNQVAGGTATTLSGVLFGNGAVVSAKALDSAGGAASTASVALKAPLASPALTGTPTAPTAASGTNTAQIATTAFVKSLGDTKAPKSHASAGVSYGLGTDAKYGHLKLSDAVDSASGVSDGIAATPAAVKAAYDLAKPYGSAGAHNAVYRGKSLGTSVTAAQWAAIAAGTFDDMYIGDYWEINSMKWLIAAFDYWYHRGDNYTGRSTHHAVIVPYTALYNAPMNDTDTAEGGYVGSKMYTANLEQAKTSVNACFGESHILKHRELLTNHVSKLANGYAFYDSTVELMSLSMLVGRPIWYTEGHEQTVNSAQLPLFFFRPDAATMYTANHDPAGDYWLRDVYNSEIGNFSVQVHVGYTAGRAAASNCGVRPVFGIC